MIVRDILARIGFKVEHEKLDKVDQQLQGIKDRLSLLAGIEIAKAMYELAERFSHLGVELRTAAMSAGLTVEAFQELAFSAKLSAVDQGQMETALFRVSRRLYEARTGSAEAQAAFQRVGFTPDQVRTFKNSEDVLLGLADKFRAIKDPIQRSAVASELMGRGSMHMVAWLSQGSKAMKEEMEQAKQLGLVLRTDQVESLTLLEHSLAKLGALINAVAGTFGADLAPAIKFIVDKFFDWYQANKALVDQNIEEWAKNVAYTFGFIIGAVAALTLDLIDLAKKFHFEKDLMKIVFWVASFATAAFTLATALGFVSIVFGAITAESLIFLGSIGLIILAISELFHMMKGGFSNTWTAQLLDRIGSFENFKDKLNSNDLFGGAASVATANTYGNTTQSTSMSSTYSASFYGGYTPDTAKNYEDSLRMIEKEKTDALMSRGQVPIR